MQIDPSFLVEVFSSPSNLILLFVFLTVVLHILIFRAKTLEWWYPKVLDYAWVFLALTGVYVHSHNFRVSWYEDEVTIQSNIVEGEHKRLLEKLHALVNGKSCTSSSLTLDADDLNQKAMYCSEVKRMYERVVNKGPSAVAGYNNYFFKELVKDGSIEPEIYLNIEKLNNIIKPYTESKREKNRTSDKQKATQVEKKWHSLTPLLFIIALALRIAKTFIEIRLHNIAENDEPVSKN